MSSITWSLGLRGLVADAIRVEVASQRGPSAFQLVGLAEASVREAHVRVRSALKLSGVEIDEYLLTVLLAPADIRKSGSLFDLAIAVALACEVRRLSQLENFAKTVWLGELSLSGAVRPVRGVLAAVLEAKRLGFERVVVPKDNGGEAAEEQGIEVCVVSSLAEALSFVGGGALDKARPVQTKSETVRSVDLSEVRGQFAARRALEIAAAGEHNLLMIGPPGSGKTMLARRLPTILPPLEYNEAREATALHSLAGLLRPQSGLLNQRPFRSPHHTLSSPAMAGGGTLIRPGEVSLAHGGVLFLDELLEFSRSTLEALRQPLEDRCIHLARARETAWFPAALTLIAAVNPCPCGYFGSTRCRCSADAVARYRRRLSGPVLDRIDLQVVLPPLPAADFVGREGESSANVLERVVAARSRQSERRQKLGLTARTNRDLSSAELTRAAPLSSEVRALLTQAVDGLGFSARGVASILRVARTIADLEMVAPVRPEHVAEAIQYRPLDRVSGAAQPSAASW